MNKKLCKECKKEPVFKNSDYCSWKCDKIQRTSLKYRYYGVCSVCNNYDEQLNKLALFDVCSRKCEFKILGRNRLIENGKCNNCNKSINKKLFCGRICKKIFLKKNKYCLFCKKDIIKSNSEFCKPSHEKKYILRQCIYCHKNKPLYGKRVCSSDCEHKYNETICIHCEEYKKEKDSNFCGFRCKKKYYLIHFKLDIEN